MTTFDNRNIFKIWKKQNKSTKPFFSSEQIFPYHSMVLGENKLKMRRTDGYFFVFDFLKMFPSMERLYKMTIVYHCIYPFFPFPKREV